MILSVKERYLHKLPFAITKKLEQMTEIAYHVEGWG
ncbi:hypothetical protein NIES2100_73960 [Calothrix sp. NIES-2100]|nr:hypothetical protein NIES2100_73960 [Calothrix sp. NIES-2100]